MLVEKISSNALYAMKSIRKECIIENGRIDHLITERKILELVNFDK